MSLQSILHNVLLLVFVAIARLFWNHEYNR